MARVELLGQAVDALGWDEALARIGAWAKARESRRVCCANVHVVVTARGLPRLAEALSGADLVVPDGAPIAWMLRHLGTPRQRRIAGPDLMWRLCEEAAAAGIGIYLYGAGPETLTRLSERLREAFPGVQIAGAESPPFRELEPAEEQAAIERINAAGAGLVFVGLGCPKQELWMARQGGRVNAVMIGVGAAFDFHAGTVRRAPPWMRRMGLEWLHRLGQEPRRLLRRYVVTNVHFLFLALAQLLHRKRRLRR